MRVLYEERDLLYSSQVAEPSLGDAVPVIFPPLAQNPGSAESPACFGVDVAATRE